MFVPPVRAAILGRRPREVKPSRGENFERPRSNAELKTKVEAPAVLGDNFGDVLDRRASPRGFVVGGINPGNGGSVARLVGGESAAANADGPVRGGAQGILRGDACFWRSTRSEAGDVLSSQH